LCHGRLREIQGRCCRGRLVGVIAFIAEIKRAEIQVVRVLLRLRLIVAGRGLR